MEKQLNWVFKLSLEQMALRKVVANEWNKFDILASIEKCRFRSLPVDYINIWRETVENKVKINVSKLVLTESLKKEMMHLVEHMGSEILNWKIFHLRFLRCEYFDTRILEQLCWTCVGTVDYRNTAERLIRLGMFDVLKKYKLACLYCLVDDIADLWEQVPKSFKGIFYKEGYSSKVKDLDMRYYWAFILNEEESKLDHIYGSELESSFCEYAFKHSVYKGNKGATEYFYRKLPDGERDSCLLRTVYDFLRDRNSIKYMLFDFPVENVAIVLSYLLSLMSPEQQMQILMQHPCEIFICFMDWPWHDLFLDIADVIWTFLPESKYEQFLDVFVVKVKFWGSYSPKFFQEFFIRSPRNFRKRVVFYHRISLFPNFFRAEDTETIKVVFRNLDIEDRVKVVSDFYFLRLLDLLIVEDKWHVVELCLREATLSKEEMKRVKEDFIFKELDQSAIPFTKHKWRIFFQTFDKTHPSALKKRSTEHKMLTRSKKARNK